jgi:hypothetical protein
MIGGVDRVEVVELEAAPADVLAVVRDLSTYAGWLDLVERAVPADDVEGDPGPAWDVELRAKVGPFARSKRLRMVRSLDDGGRARDGGEGMVATARFERREADGREHSPWVLTAEVEGAERGGSTLTMRLHYGGGLYGPVLDKVLGDAVARGRGRLPEVISGR